jgi:alpha-L-fucosidase
MKIKTFLLLTSFFYSFISQGSGPEKTFYTRAEEVFFAGNNATKTFQDSIAVNELRKEFLTWKFGMFIHFNMATFNEREWAIGYEDPYSFSPDKLDCNQWAEVALGAGMKYAVLTVKHTGGWCLWDSKYTASHDIKAFKNYDKGDIVRQFVDAFRKRGLKIGLYYCFPGDYAGRNGKLVPEGKTDLHGLPPEAQGDYVGFIKNQLTELLTDYGKIDLLWIDQFRNKYTYPAWPEIQKHIKTLQPTCLVLGNNGSNYIESDILSYEYPWLKNSRPDVALPPEDNSDPSEVCDKIGPGWFWKEDEKATTLKTAQEIVHMLNLSNHRSANYLLNIAPDNTGLIPVHSVQRLEEFRVLMKK